MKDKIGLKQAIEYFSDPDRALDYMIKLRWPDGVVTCPTCGRKDPVFLKNQRKWQCKSVHPKRQFSVKVGTVFEDSPIPIDKWLVAVWMLSNCRNGVSSYELSRALGITQKSGWFMLHRIRETMSLNGTPLGGPGDVVETDETYVGGKLKNMHRSKRSVPVAGERIEMKNKTAVMGFLNRTKREVSAQIIPFVRSETVQAMVRRNVLPGTTLYTDSFGGYNGCKEDYVHAAVNHLEEYVRGNVHTNGIENFWSLLKRSLSGTYVGVEPCHLQRYVDEQVFRYNNRKDDGKPVSDLERFDRAMHLINGKRLTFAQVTGKVRSTIN
jgi:transposase-like protein